MKKYINPIEHIAQNMKSVFSVENLHAEVSGGYFARYLGPQLLCRSKIAEKYRAFIDVHHDGKLGRLFGRLKEVGVKYVNGITASFLELETLPFRAICLIFLMTL